MKIDITDEPHRIETQKQLSLEHPDKYFVPVWENDRFYMVDEKEIATKLKHYQKLAGLMWFVHHNGFVTMKLGKMVL